MRDLEGAVRYEKRLRVSDLAGNGTRQLMTLPAVAGLSRVYFIELDLASGDGKPVSRNVYWLSTQADVLDWEHSNWYLTPVTQYADFTPLQSLATVASDVHATLRHEGAEDVATVTLSVPASAKGVALFQHVSLKRSAGGEPIVPIVWSDNDVTLWPGESLTLSARFAGSAAATPTIDVSGWNVPTRSLPLTEEKH